MGGNVNERGGSMSKVTAPAFFGTRAEIAGTIVARLKGLERLRRPGSILVLAPCSDIHTFTMRGPIDVAFVSAGGVVLKACRGVKPHRRLRCKGSVIVLERYSVDGPWFEAGESLGLTIMPRPAYVAGAYPVGRCRGGPHG